MKIVIDPHYQHNAPFIAQLPRLFDEGQVELIYAKRNQVGRVSHQGEAMIVKRFKRVNVVQRVVYSFFRKTKAERAYLFAEEYRRRGIMTPRRVAYMERRQWGLFTVGYFVSAEAQGTECHLLLREVKDFDVKLADAVAEQVVLMHSRGVLHGDLNLSNFLCTADSDGYHFTMIDINRSKFTTGMPSDNACLKNLVRLTHRRDLYDYLVRSYARQRGWDEDATAVTALQLLNKFEH